jgi:small-conductance mechanosensitive channel
MKTLASGAAMGLFGAAAVLLSHVLEWPGWVLFIAWVSFYLFGKSVKRSIAIYLQIALGIVLGVLIRTTGTVFAEAMGLFGLPLSVFLFIGLLAFVTKIKGLTDVAAWFIGLIVFFGTHPPLEFTSITRLLLPLAAGFTFGWLLETVTRRVHTLASSLAETD